MDWPNRSELVENLDAALLVFISIHHCRLDNWSQRNTPCGKLGQEGQAEEILAAQEFGHKFQRGGKVARVLISWNLASSSHDCMDYAEMKCIMRRKTLIITQKNDLLLPRVLNISLFISIKHLMHWHHNFPLIFEYEKNIKSKFLSFLLVISSFYSLWREIPFLQNIRSDVMSAQHFNCTEDKDFSTFLS